MEKRDVSLYVVATPIGNLSDLSPRAIEVLKSVDFVAAEDTRNSGVLLKYFDIKKPLVSYHEHNVAKRGGEIIDRLLKGLFRMRECLRFPTPEKFLSVNATKTVFASVRFPVRVPLLPPLQ